ncbi:MAG TPA: hypothetical protein VGC15_13460 [Acetobacteraceae bacterium]
MATAHLNMLAAARPGGAPQVTVLLGEGHQHEEALRALLAGLAPGARILRVGNPLRSPLTIERILIQSGQPAVGMLTDEAAEDALQRLCLRHPSESRVVLVIDQAETLNAVAIRILSRLVAPGGRPSAGMAALLHVVLVGLPSFKQLLKDKAAAPIRDALAQGSLQVPDAAASVTAENFPPPADLTPFLTQRSGAAASEEVVKWPVVSSPAAERNAAPPLVQPASTGRSPLDQAVMLLIVLCVVGAGTVVGLPYILQWLGIV